MSVDRAPDALIVAGAVVVALGVLWRALRPLMKFHRKASAAFDIVTGQPAEIDPLSSRVLREAVPDIGTRMYEMNEKIDTVAMRLVKDAVDSASSSLAASEAAGAASEAARAASEAARAASQAAAESARAAHRDANETRSVVARLAERVADWQNVDRQQAETMRSAVTELLLPDDPPELAH